MRAGGAHSNRDRLAGFVTACLDLAKTAAPGERPALLRRAARRVEGQLRTLSAWAAAPDERPPPAHLQGLSAFDLSDAMDRLDAAAQAYGPAR